MDILNEIKQAVQSVDESAEVILFGSRARGDYNDDSDWDVLILTNNEQDDRDYKREIRHALLDIEIKQAIVITALIRNKNFWNQLNVTPFFNEVQKDGMLL